MLNPRKRIGHGRQSRAGVPALQGEPVTLTTTNSLLLRDMPLSAYAALQFLSFSNEPPMALAQWEQHKGSYRGPPLIFADSGLR